MEEITTLKCKSKHSKSWAAKAFDEWLLCKGLSIEKSISDLSEEEDLMASLTCYSNFFFKFRRWMEVCIFLIRKYICCVFFSGIYFCLLLVFALMFNCVVL